MYSQTLGRGRNVFYLLLKAFVTSCADPVAAFPGKCDWKLPSLRATTHSLAWPCSCQGHVGMLEYLQGSFSQCQLTLPGKHDVKSTSLKLGLTNESFSACDLSAAAFCFLGLGWAFPTGCFLDGLEQEAAPELAFSRDSGFVPRSVSVHVHGFLCVLQIGKEYWLQDLKKNFFKWEVHLIYLLF